MTEQMEQMEQMERLVTPADTQEITSKVLAAVLNAAAEVALETRRLER